MNHLFRRLSLSAKLMLMALIPLALLVYFAIQIYLEKTERINLLGNYLHRIDQSVDINNLVDELQTERRYSFGYVVNRNWRMELAVQRPRTDATIQKVLSNQDMSNAASYTFLDSLSAIRSRVDVPSIAPLAAMRYYSNAIFRLNAFNTVSVANVHYLDNVKSQLAAQKLLSEMVTNLGTIRSNIYYALYVQQLPEVAAQESKDLYDIYRSYEREFLLKGNAAAIRAYQHLKNQTELGPTISFIDQLFATSQFNGKYTAESWWKLSASAVDAMKRLQRSQLKEVQEGVSETYEREKTQRDRSLLFLILAIVAVLGVVTYTITVITRILKELNEAALRLSQGAAGVRIDVPSRDVIGSLARSIHRIDENNTMLAQAAQAIGSGNFAVAVTPRSSEDVLGNAVARMKEDLEQFNKENEEKLWLLDGVEKINDSLRGEQQVKEVAQNALQTLAAYLEAPLGLFYVRFNNHLQYTAGYAASDSADIPQQIGMGETLVGQAAQKKELLVLHQLPNDFIRVRTASGSAAPTFLLLMPLVHNGVTEGVMEIGALERFSERSLSLVRQVAPSVAIALQSAKSRARLQELFEQTQSQSEELQAQHGELENINAELEAQTEKLQASEEELRVQQEELLQTNEELEERSRLLEERNQVIVERNIEIQQKAEELAQSTKYKSEFLANMSHELRTPLNSVLLLSRLLSENNEKNLSPEQVEYAQVIQSSGHGLLTLIDEILDLSKIEAGKMELEYHSMAMQEVVNDMKALFGPVAREKGLELHLEIDAAAPARIETDKLRLEQVLKNLLSNALKFTKQGSVRLCIEPLKDNQHFVSFVVKDTGIGIPQEKQALIFEAFQQADGSTRRKFGGTGLGLSISRELVRLLGGEIKVSSEAGKGSEFTIYIPISRQAAAYKVETTNEIPAARLTPTLETAPAPKPARGYRTELIPEAPPDDRNVLDGGDKLILIIEDDTAFAKALLDYTHQKGYKGLVAVRGDEGIALAQEFRPLGILLDIQLPVKDGWEVMEELKSNPATRHIPVHIMSSLEAKRESLMKGAVDFINKPIAFEQMQEVFKRIEGVLNREHKKVLIVEENPKHARALAYFLETCDVKTQISSSVNKGLDALKEEAVDCVILDMGIPDRQAYETLEAVKKQPGLEHLPIIIFTGKNLSKTEESRIKQYADSIVVKTAHSYQRILDEVSLFLHLVEENNGADKQSRYKRMGALKEVLADKKILITDDDVRNIFSLTKALEIHNMRVITAVDGKEALKQLEANPDTNIVLMDIMMPEMDGYEAMQKIRSNKAFRQLPVIAVTAKAMTGDREKCIQAGASDYISKPVDIDQLLSLLRVWLYDKTI